MVIGMNGKELTKAIEKGISDGATLAKDDGIDFKITECHTTNGNTNELGNYISELRNNNLSEKNKLIINKYKNL